MIIPRGCNADVALTNSLWQPVQFDNCMESNVNIIKQNLKKKKRIQETIKQNTYNMQTNCLQFPQLLSH